MTGTELSLGELMKSKLNEISALCKQAARCYTPPRRVRLGTSTNVRSLTQALNSQLQMVGLELRNTTKTETRSGTTAEYELGPMRLYNGRTTIEELRAMLSIGLRPDPRCKRHTGGGVFIFAPYAEIVHVLMLEHQWFLS